MLKSIKAFLEKKLPILVLILLVIQPVMDVISYFLSKTGDNTVSTLLRVAMLAAVALLGFAVTERRRAYYCVYGIMAGYWLLHVLNCYRVGYLSVVQDTANYLRILTFPVFLLSFLSFFQKSGEELRKILGLGFAVNTGLSVLFTALPWGLYLLGLGEPVYTYDTLFLGIMGWFAIPNAQSCIIILLAPLTLYFAYRTGKVWLFLLACVASFGLMFVTGTKLTYYSMFLIPAAYIVVLLLNPNRKSAIPFLAVLVGVLVVCGAFRGHTPMQVRESMNRYSQGLYGSLVEKSLEGSGTDEETMESIQKGTINEDNEEERVDPADMLSEVRRVLLGVYADPEVYGEILEDLNDRFGAYNVIDAYRYSASTWTLSDLRLRKTNYAKLVWQECDLPTKLLGFEYSEVLYNGNVYDLENDFPAVMYNCGWLGFALYLLLLLYVAWEVLRAFAWNPLRFFTMEMSAAGLTLVLALGSAQISGYVLRRPNVAIYLAVAAAYLCRLCGNYISEQPRIYWWKKEFWQPIRERLRFRKRGQ